jgi:hypothetical protein
VRAALIAVLLGLATAGAMAAELDRTPVEAVTVNGEKVRLFPNGRWEYVDAAKAAAAQQKAAAIRKTRPRAGRAGFVGRTVMPGDGLQPCSLNPVALISAAAGRRYFALNSLQSPVAAGRVIVASVGLLAHLLHLLAQRARLPPQPAAEKNADDGHHGQRDQRKHEGQDQENCAQDKGGQLGQWATRRALSKLRVLPGAVHGRAHVVKMRQL